MALTNMRFKDQIGLNLGEENRGEEKEKRRREEEEVEEEEEGRRSSKPRSRGMELTLDMNSIMDFVWNSRKYYEFQT